MTTLKCKECGLVTFAATTECARCGGSCADHSVEPFGWNEPSSEMPSETKRGIVRRILAGFGLSFFLLCVCYISLLESSDAANYDQRELVARSIDVIERSGFPRDAFLLRRLANYRTTDHWWNRWHGHGEAYAATNFPFQIVTLYPEFFRYPVDDIERAAILLHEARHLAGDDEEAAFASVWRDKERLGWTVERYGQTRVWRNVREYTARYNPKLFDCEKTDVRC